MTEKMITATKGDGQVHTDIFAEGGRDHRHGDDLLPGSWDGSRIAGSSVSRPSPPRRWTPDQVCETEANPTTSGRRTQQ